MKSITLNTARLGLGILAAVFCLSLSAGAHAEDMMPAMTNENTKEITVQGGDTHPPVRLTPDKTEMVHIDEPAGSIIIGNPAHLNVMLNNPRTLLLAPRVPGATQLTVINNSGKVIMQRHVIVSGPKEQYVRVRRACVNGGNTCQPISVYYCPGGLCHETQILAGQGTNYTAGGYVSAGADSETDRSAAAPTEETLEDEPPLLSSDEEGANDTEPDDSLEDVYDNDNAPSSTTPR